MLAAIKGNRRRRWRRARQDPRVSGLPGSCPPILVLFFFPSRPRSQLRNLPRCKPSTFPVPPDPPQVLVTDSFSSEPDDRPPLHPPATPSDRVCLLACSSSVSVARSPPNRSIPHAVGFHRFSPRLPGETVPRVPRAWGTRQRREWSTEARETASLCSVQREFLSLGLGYGGRLNASGPFTPFTDSRQRSEASKGAPWCRGLGFRSPWNTRRERSR